MPICDKCSAGILEGANFCPQCGDSVTEEDFKSVPALENQIMMAEVTFGYSSSPNYQKALGICQNIPSYQVYGEDKQRQHKITIPVTEIELLINLYDLVGSWKSSQMLINGHSSTKKQLTYYGLGCFKNRQKAYKPEQYCFGEKDYEANIWGCKKLNMPIYEWGGGWLEYGHIDKSGIWHFDKNRIRHELDLAIKENEFCPVLNRKKIMETLEALPDTVDPRKNKNWQYRTEYKEVCVGIKPVLKKANFYVLGDFKPAWESDGNSSSTNININISQDKRNFFKNLLERKISPKILWGIIIAGLCIIYFLS